jgi:uncharacterized repeat protein (TIGR01451 family)
MDQLRQFIGPSYDLDSRPHSVQRTVNMMPVPLEPGNERTGWVFKDVPGLTEFELIVPVSDVSLVKTQSAATTVEGATHTYTIVVTNDGVTVGSGTVVVDDLPEDFVFASCTIAYAGGAAGPASATEAQLLAGVAITVFPSSATATLTITGEYATAASYDNTATATPPSGTVATDTVTTTVEVPGALDAFETGIWAAYGITRLFSIYTGPLVRVSRSTDAAQMDIEYLADGTMDVATLTTFLGGATANIVTLYDQTNNEHHSSPTVIVGSPLTLTSDGFVFSGSSSAVVTNTQCAVRNSFTVYFRTTPIAYNGAEYLVVLGDSVIDNDVGAYFGHNNATSRMFANIFDEPTVRTGIAAFAEPLSTGAAHNIAVRFDRSQAGHARYLSMLDGATLTFSAFESGALGSIGASFAARYWRIGGVGAGSDIQMTMKTALIYEASHAEAEMIAISAALP